MLLEESIIDLVRLEGLSLRVFLLRTEKIEFIYKDLFREHLVWMPNGGFTQSEHERWQKNEKPAIWLQKTFNYGIPRQSEPIVEQEYPYI